MDEKQSEVHRQEHERRSAKAGNLSKPSCRAIGHMQLLPYGMQELQRMGGGYKKPSGATNKGQLSKP
jgi:hypothetical protein